MKPSQLLASPVFWAAVADIRGLLSGDPLLPFAERPTEQLAYKLNNAGHQPLVQGSRGWMSHYYDAKQQVHQSPVDAPSSKVSAGVFAAVQRVAAFQTCTRQSVQGRKDKMAAMITVANSLSGLNAAVRAAMPPAARAVAGGMQLATMEAIRMATVYPDVQLAWDFAYGFDICGDITPCSIYPPKLYPRVSSLCDLDHKSWNEAVVSQLSYSWRTATVAKRASLAAITAATEAAVTAGLASPAIFDINILTAEYGDNWRCMVRFPAAKDRPCDNACTSQHNGCTGLKETIKCVGAEMPAHIAKLFASAWGGPFHDLNGGTDDLKQAYWRVPNGEPRWSIVALYHTDAQRVAFYKVHGLSFGLVSAVVQFNRFPEFMVHAAQRIFDVVVDHYFDDYCTVEPAYMEGTGQTCLSFLHSLVGFVLEPTKHVAAANIFTFLGVQTDFTHFMRGFAQMLMKPGRDESITEAAARFVDSGFSTGAERSSLVGKLYFTISTAFGRVGTAALQVLRDDDAPESQLRMVILFFSALILAMPARKIWVAKRNQKKPILIWSDASYSQWQAEAMTLRDAGLGVVICDPETGVSIIAEAQTPSYFFALFVPKQQYVGQLEALAALCAYTTAAVYRPGMFMNRNVVHFIDNTSVIAGLRKGYSSRPDTALILVAFWLLMTLLQCTPWFEYVPSKLNIADLPSRGDTQTALDCTGLTATDFTFPDKSMWEKDYADWPALLRRQFAKPSRTAKRNYNKRKRNNGESVE